MKRVLVPVLALLALACAVVGGGALWGRRPWRVAVSVNGHALSAGELDLRARALYEDACRTNAVPADGGGVPDAFRRRAAQMWIVKEVLLAEALARGYSATPADEQDSLAQMSVRLKGRGLAPEAFFREGPLPEALKRRDFREGVLVNKFVQKEVRDPIVVKGEEIDARQAALQRTSGPVSRKAAMDAVRAERFRKGFIALVRGLRRKADVRCVDYPELAREGAVAPGPSAGGEAK